MSAYCRHRLSYINLFICIALILGLGSCKSSSHSHKNDYESVKNAKIEVGPDLRPIKESETDKKDKKKRTEKLVAEANKWIGTPYRYGGTTRKGTDCSGFVFSTFKEAIGITLPRSSAAMAEVCKTIKRKELKVGDLLFFKCGKSQKKINHVGLYVGDGIMIHASSSLGVVKTNIDDPYFVKYFHHAARVPQLYK